MNMKKIERNIREDKGFKIIWESNRTANEEKILSKIDNRFENMHAVGNVAMKYGGECLETLAAKVIKIRDSNSYCAGN